MKVRTAKNGLHNGSVHHRLPRRLGGPDTLSNCVFVCLDCHRDIHRDETAAAREGWIAWGEPDVTPVLRRARGRGPGWVLLVPDGSLEYLSHQEGEWLAFFLNGITQAS